jgi:exopolyphosphatase/guanosine-5'-triphosphate,3'-diphosphate pyrophosphatase
MIIRIIDIGSNSVKASLYSVEQGRHKMLSREKLDYSLGNAVFSEGAIPDSGMDRVVSFILSKPEPRTQERPHFTFALATSAVRSASNRDAFVKRIQNKTGIEVRVLSGAEESYLIHTGIVSQAGAAPGEVIKTIDIGGGSAEVSWSRGGNYLFGKSYELGAIRLTRRFLSGKTFTREVFQRVYDHAAAEFLARSPASNLAADRAIGSSGNVRAIGRMAATVRASEFSKTVAPITTGTLEDIVEAALNKTPAQIAETFGLNTERASIVMPAVAVLLAGMRHFDMRRLETTEAGLREGAVDFWSRHGHFNLPLKEEDVQNETSSKSKR